VAKLCQLKHFVLSASGPSFSSNPSFPSVFSHIEKFEFNLALDELWQRFGDLDAKISVDAPWEKPDKEAGKYLEIYVKEVLKLAVPLSIFLPETVEKIGEIFRGPKVAVPERPLFPRLKL
jgi:methionyl-tRNA synthetase